MRDEAVEQLRGEVSEVSNVAMTSPLLLLRTEQLHEDFGLPTRELVDGVPLGRKVDETCLIDLVPVFDPDCAHVAERAFQPAFP